MVKRIAGNIFGVRSFDGIPFEEYVQYGVEGLLQAFQRYDPALGAKFETYAQFRIKGAIVSGLEKSSEVNQQVATLRRMAQERIDSLIANSDGAVPTLQNDPQAAFDRLVETSLGLAVAFMLDDSGLFQHNGSTHWDDGPSNLAYKQLQQRLLAAMTDNLTDNERAVLEWHYFEHESFDVAADQLGLSKGRISQLHRSALRKLRTALTVHKLSELIA